MLKVLLAIAPHFLRGAGKSRYEKSVRRLGALALFFLSGIMLSIALFIYLLETFDVVVAWATLGAIFLMLGLICLITSRPKPKAQKVVEDVELQDPLANLIPEIILKDPKVARLITEMTEHPLTTSLAAASIGMMATREVMKD